MMSNNSISTTLEDPNNTISERRPYPHPAQEVIMWVIPVLNITLNLLVFIVVPRIKTLRVSTTIGMLSLAVTDFSHGITGLSNMIYNTYAGFQIQTNHPVCALVSTGLALFTSVSIVMLAYLMLDRLLTFLYPLSYQLLRKKVIIINIVIWVGVTVLQIPNVAVPMGFKHYEYAFLCLPVWTGNVPYKSVWLVLLLFIPTIISIVSFCGSFYLVRNRHKRMTVRAPTVRVHIGRQLSDNPDSQWSRDRRTFKVLAIMTFGVYIAWFPYVITVAFPEIITGRTLHPVTDFITPQLAGSNSFWNPIIYMLTLKPFSRALSQLYRNTLCGRYMLRRAGGGNVVRPSPLPNTRTGDTNTGDVNLNSNVNANVNAQEQ